MYPRNAERYSTSVLKKWQSHTDMAMHNQLGIICGHILQSAFDSLLPQLFKFLFVKNSLIPKFHLSMTLNSKPSILL